MAAAVQLAARGGGVAAFLLSGLSQQCAGLDTNFASYGGPVLRFVLGQTRSRSGADWGSFPGMARLALT